MKGKEEGGMPCWGTSRLRVEVSQEVDFRKYEEQWRGQ